MARRQVIPLVPDTLGNTLFALEPTAVSHAVWKEVAPFPPFHIAMLPLGCSLKISIFGIVWVPGREKCCVSLRVVA